MIGIDRLRLRTMLRQIYSHKFGQPSVPVFTLSLYSLIIFSIFSRQRLALQLPVPVPSFLFNASKDKQPSAIALLIVRAVMPRQMHTFFILFINSCCVLKIYFPTGNPKGFLFECFLLI